MAGTTVAASRAAWGKLPARARYLALGCALALLVWLGLVFAVAPRRAARLLLDDEIRALTTASADLRSQIATLRNEARSEEAVRRSVAEIRQRLEETLSRLPENRALAAFLRDLTAPEAGDGVAFLSITPQPLIKRGELSELPFTLELAGTYRSVTRYLARLELLPRLVTVQNISLNSPAADKPSELRATITAATYILERHP